MKDKEGKQTKQITQHRENRWGNQERTIQRHWHHWVCKTKEENRQSK